MRKYTFGYYGARETYWLYAKSEAHLFRLLNKKGMAKPDWIDPATTA